MNPAVRDRVTELLESRSGAAQLCVLRYGEVVLDISVNCRPDSLFMLWSTGKPFTTMATHLLAERGQLDLDEPIHRYWPGYERNGKDAITARHVLRHRSGVPLSTGSVLRDALIMSDWDRSVRAAEDAKPQTPADKVNAYHILSYGFILGELVRRVEGRPIARFIREEILDPAGLRDTHLGLPPEIRPRRMTLVTPRRGHQRATLGDRLKLRRFERHAAADAVIPAANVHSTARDVARFYQLLLDDGVIDDQRVFAPKTIAEALRPSLPDSEATRPDRVIGHAVRWAQGFQLGWGDIPVTTARPLGTTADRNVFGHNGSNHCAAWADPANGLVCAHVSNLVAPRADALRHQAAISDLIRCAFSSPHSSSCQNPHMQ